MLLSFSNVSFSYNGSEDVLKNISFRVDYGEKIALLGLNGAGKSTLMLHTNGLLLPNKGDVIIEGLNTKSKSVKEIRKKVGLVFQNSDDQLFMPTVYDDIAFGPRNMNITEEEVKERVEMALELTRTNNLQNLSPYDLSGGQKKSVALATILSMTPELLVMDEPTSGLDYKSIKNFISIIEPLKQTMILSTHDMEIARALCSRAIILQEGEIVFDGKLQEANYPPA